MQLYPRSMKAFEKPNASHFEIGFGGGHFCGTTWKKHKKALGCKVKKWGTQPAFPISQCILCHPFVIILSNLVSCSAVGGNHLRSLQVRILQRALSQTVTCASFCADLCSHVQYVRNIFILTYFGVFWCIVPFSWSQMPRSQVIATP